MLNKVKAMKQKILFGVMIVAVFVLGVFSVRAWDHYKVEARAKQAIVEANNKAEAEAKVQAETKRAQAEADEKDRLKVECENGLKAFNLMTVAQQAKATKPVCDLPQVE